MYCTNCGFHILPGSDFKFCPQCGSQIAVPTGMPAAAPLHGHGDMSEVPTPAEVRPEPATGQPRILIVEDDMFIRELYQKQLEIAHFYVETAADGLEGREKVKAQPWDVVLLDIMLPKMNGLDLLKVMKQDPNTQNTPVIILSNLGQDSVVEKGLSLGAISYLVKADTTPAEMLALIRQKITQ